MSRARSPRAPAASSRREFLRVVGAAAAFGVSPAALTADETLPAFSEIPSASMRDFLAARERRSSEMYLPETTGAGCAFLDYDNDGWMDIYLVNSGRCDFYDSRSAAAQCALSQQSRRHVHRRNRKGGRCGRRLRQGVAVGDYDGDGFPDMYVTAIRPKHPLSQQRRRNIHRRHRRRPASPLRDGLPARSGSTTTTTAASICSSADSSNSAKTKNKFCGNARHRASADIASRQSTIPCRSWLFHNNGDGTFTDVSKAIGHREVSRQGLGCGGRRHQQRRLDGSVRRQRHRRRIFSS